MSRYDIRISELAKLGYTLDQAKELAKIEEAERQTDALERIADALEKQNDRWGNEINISEPAIETAGVDAEKFGQAIVDCLRKNILT